MIPADTPPGTSIVCIDVSPGIFRGPQLVLGGVYTLRHWFIGANNGEASVLLFEATAYHSSGNELGCLARRFRLLERPHELYSLLETATRETETVG